jgi:hypothetical protein
MKLRFNVKISNEGGRNVLNTNHLEYLKKQKCEKIKDLLNILGSQPYTNIKN